MNAFDWLGNMELPGVDMFDVVEVRFKGGRKEFFKNQQRLFLTTGDPIVVEMQSGYHVGYVSLQGELVRLQMKKKKVAENTALPIIYRVATDKDLERLEDIKKREMPTMFRTRQIIEQLDLGMKLSDVEFQADNSKATFYYSADDRVDFRELIKILAGEFKIRVEMRQISLRQEAGRIGGIGSCGRELCCSTWLTDFKSVSTSAARYQNLSLNPSKLSGQCGRLKCCLNYELETYQDALIDIPQVKSPLRTQQGEAKLQKVDIFKKILWFSVEKDNNWYPVEAERVAMIQELNKQDRMPDLLMSEEMMMREEYKALVSTDTRRQVKARSMQRSNSEKGKSPAAEHSKEKRTRISTRNKPASKEAAPKPKPNTRTRRSKIVSGNKRGKGQAPKDAQDNANSNNTAKPNSSRRNKKGKVRKANPQKPLNKGGDKPKDKPNSPKNKPANKRKGGDRPKRKENKPGQQNPPKDKD